MSNRWIISDYHFHEHRTLALAQKELERLKSKFPDKAFSIYRIKGRLTPSDAPQTIKKLNNDIFQLSTALNALIHTSMFKDHPTESKMAVDVLAKHGKNV